MTVMYICMLIFATGEQATNTNQSTVNTTTSSATTVATGMAYNQ